MCEKYEEYKTLTKQAMAAKMRGEHDYSLELLQARELPDAVSLGAFGFIKGSHGSDPKHAGNHGE